jgi:hypothetical protein
MNGGHLLLALLGQAENVGWNYGRGPEVSKHACRAACYFL